MPLSTFHFSLSTFHDDLDLRFEPNGELSIYLLFAELYEKKHIVCRRIFYIKDKIRMFRGDYGAAPFSTSKTALSDELCRRDHGDWVGFYGKRRTAIGDRAIFYRVAILFASGF